MFVLTGIFILITAFTEIVSLDGRIAPDECEPMLDITGLQNSNDIYTVKYTKRKDTAYEIQKMEFISDTTNMTFPADWINMNYLQQKIFFSIETLNFNESYTLNITCSTLADKFTNGCEFSIFSRFIKQDVSNQSDCVPLLETTNLSQVSDEILLVKYDKESSTDLKILGMQFISDKPHVKFPAMFLKLNYTQQMIFFSIKNLNFNEFYTLSIIYDTNENELTNRSCEFSTFSRFIKQNVTNHIKCEPLLGIKNLSQGSNTDSGIQFFSDKYGMKFPVHLVNMTNYNWSMVFSIKYLDTNQFVQLNITHEYGSCIFSNATKKNNVVQERKNNIDIFIAIFVIAGVAITLLFIYTGQKTKLQVLLKKLKSLIFPWYSNPSNNTSELIVEFADGSGREEINPLYQPLEQCLDLYDRFEFPRENIEMKNIIGHGEFGEVYYAKARGLFGRGYVMVAVKTMKNDSSDQARTDFLREINTLKKIGEHKNIVKMLACVTKEEPYMIIMELIRNGNLKDYLLELRKIWEDRKNTKFFDGKMDDSHVQPDRELECENENKDCAGLISGDGIVVYEPEATTPVLEDASPPPFPILDHMELQSFASQIASGMAHLEEIGITHRDLAARNILITKEKILKITDFGMSRPRPYVHVNMVRKIPLRWYSIEAIKELRITNKSDVWSFGVVLWEIGTLGAFPYGDMACDAVIHYLKSGRRLGRPEICTDVLYDVMLRCWKERPEDRPSFSELVKEFDVHKRHVYLEFRKIRPDYVFPQTSSDE